IVNNSVYSPSRDAVLIGYLLMVFVFNGRTSNLSDLQLCQFCLTVPTAFISNLKPRSKSMQLILRLCTPLQILDIVIHLIAVFVINKRLVFWIRNKRFGNQSVSREGLVCKIALSIEPYPQISI